MVANILPIDTLSTQGMGSNGQTTFFSVSSPGANQIKGNSIEHYESKYAVLTHHQPLGWDQLVFFFLKVVMLHIKLK